MIIEIKELLMEGITTTENVQCQLCETRYVNLSLIQTYQTSTVQLYSKNLIVHLYNMIIEHKRNCIMQSSSTAQLDRDVGITLVAECQDGQPYEHERLVS